MSSDIPLPPYTITLDGPEEDGSWGVVVRVPDGRRFATAGATVAGAIANAIESWPDDLRALLDQSPQPTGEAKGSPNDRNAWGSTGDALPSHPHDGYAYEGCRCVCCTNVRALATPPGSFTGRRPAPHAVAQVVAAGDSYRRAYDALAVDWLAVLRALRLPRDASRDDVLRALAAAEGRPTGEREGLRDAAQQALDWFTLDAAYYFDEYGNNDEPIEQLRAALQPSTGGQEP